MRAGVAICAVVALLAAPGGAHAAGMTTHAWMADVGIERVDDGGLKKLLRAHRHTVLSGASYPDAGYYLGAVHPGADFGEISHWEQFVNAYVAHIRSKPTCDGTLADARGPCAQLVAHLMGVAAHGLGDETWDWMFESQMPATASTRTTATAWTTSPGGPSSEACPERAATCRRCC